MEFGNTYIFLFGFKMFEPMVLLMNSIFFILCLLYFNRLNKYHHPYAKQMARFILLLGTSSLFGAIGHGVQLQMGDLFFKIILFLMNAFSLFSIYFCFRSAYTYSNLNKEPAKKYIYLVITWVFILLIASGIQGNFLVIKIHAGIVLLYSLIAHYIVYRRNHDNGSLGVVIGILISFLPIIVHSLRISMSEWFNHKDIAHTLMIISLIVIYKGVKISSERLKHV